MSALALRELTAVQVSRRMRWSEALSDAPAVPDIAEPEVGSISLGLRVDRDLQLDSFAYAIVGPNFSSTGAIDVSHSTTVTALIGGIPAATGYSLTLGGATSSTPKLQCTGSATFDVSSGSVTTLPVLINCRTEDVPPAVQAPVPPIVAWLLGVFLLAAGVLFATRAASEARAHRGALNAKLQSGAH